MRPFRDTYIADMSIRFSTTPHYLTQSSKIIKDFDGESASIMVLAVWLRQVSRPNADRV